MLAPNTDTSNKYGILISGSTIYTNGVPANTMYLGRPWHNSADAFPRPSCETPRSTPASPPPIPGPT
ncbi:hypothetical protein ACRAWF_15330 [Streptomyces sp. L7]